MEDVYRFPNSPYCTCVDAFDALEGEDAAEEGGGHTVSDHLMHGPT